MGAMTRSPSRPPEPDPSPRRRGPVTVLIPARNEEESLPGVLDELARSGAEYRVLVVDNGSTDATAEEARRAGAAVVAEPRPGYGRACQAGIAAEARRERPPSVLAFLDADDRLGPGQLPRVVEPVRRGDADLVLGRRRRADGVPIHAAAGNALISALLRGIYGWPGRDMGPLRAVRFPALRALALDDPNFGWNVQMHVRALRAGLRVREVPVRFAPRERGESKISHVPSAVARAGTKMIGTLIREGLRPGRRPP